MGCGSDHQDHSRGRFALSARKPSLLLISGWAIPISAWEPVIRELEPEWTTHVIGADAVLSGWAPDQDSALIPGRIESHLPTSAPGCILGGWSLGGMLALEAAPHLTHRIAGTLLISTTPRFCRGKGQAYGVAPAELRAMTVGMRRDPERTLRGFYAACAAPLSPDPGEMDRWIGTYREDFLSLLSGLQYLRHADLRSRMDCGGIPAVLLHGGRDTVIPTQASRTLGDHLHSSRVDLIADAGHDLPLRRPGLVARSLRTLVEARA